MCGDYGTGVHHWPARRCQTSAAKKEVRDLTDWSCVLPRVPRVVVGKRNNNWRVQ